MTAASRAKRLDSRLDVLILEKTRFISYSICGVPYLVEGLVEQAERLVRFTCETLWKQRQIRARTDFEVREILPARRLIVGVDLKSAKTESIPYDFLLIATGYTPRAASLAGLEGPQVYTLSKLEDGLASRDAIAGRATGKAAIVGGGYIGLSMSEALRHRGWQVAVIEKNSAVYPTLDRDISSLIEQELRRQGVSVHLSNAAKGFLRDRDGILRGVELEQGRLDCDLALVDVGIRPNVELARAAGIPVGASGAIAVSERMETRTTGIFAAGNCAEAVHLISGRPVVSALGTAAVKQGRVAGENMAGVRSTFAGILGTAVSRVFNLTVAETGLSSAAAAAAGFQVGGARVTVTSKAAYFAGSQPVTVKLVFDQITRRLLGAQMVGDPAVAKRIDVAAAALTAGFRLEDLAQLDMAYAPPYAPLWDPLLVAANVALRGL